MSEYFHSVTLDREKCRGCINCIKRCPTEAIRVRNGKAKIIKERCIDCGECIRVCPHHAKWASCDSMDRLSEFAYRVALVPPSFFGQFKSGTEPDQVLTALKQIGFDDVFEVARAADIVTDATKKFLRENKEGGPYICTACPACLRLIRIRFPNLIPNLLPVLSPMDIAGSLAKQEAVEKTGLPPEQIGVFFLSPCAAKVTSVKAPLGVDHVDVDGAFSVAEVYAKTAAKLSKLDRVEKLSQATGRGFGWGISGGESSALKNEAIIAVDGIDNVIGVLEQLENDRIKGVEYLEINACVGGCVGGPLNVENNFLARSRVQAVKKELSRLCPKPQVAPYDKQAISFQKPVTYASIMQLDDNIVEALRKMDSIDAIEQELPGLDCGSCGAPSCRALAEDIVRGFGSMGDCMFKLKERLRTLAKEMVELEEHMPPPFRTGTESEEKR